MKQEFREWYTLKDINEFDVGASEPEDATLRRLFGRELQSASGENYYINPSEAEYGPNPVMHKHLRFAHEPEKGLDSRTNYADFETLRNIGIGLFPPIEHETEYEDVYNEYPYGTVSEDISGTLSETYHDNGPARKRVELSSFPCSDCDKVFTKKHERKYVQLQQEFPTSSLIALQQTLQTHTRTPLSVHL